MWEKLSDECMEGVVRMWVVGRILTKENKFVENDVTGKGV